MPFGNIPLNDGNLIPAIAFGTGSALFGREVSENVELAIETGFSHIDTAAIYGNERSVGVAIRESGLSREELYITTKYDGWLVTEKDWSIASSIRASLALIGIKSVDLYLIHFPVFIEKDFEGGWREFEKIKEEGLAKSIGVSNFNLQQLQAVVKVAKIKPAVNQISLNPYNYAENKSLLEYCAQQNIIVEAYSSLAPITKTPGGPVDDVVATIAKRIGAVPAQVLLKWVISKGVVVVTTSSNKKHLDEYLAVSDLSDLTPEEIAAIDKAGAKGPPSKILQLISLPFPLPLPIVIGRLMMDSDGNWRPTFISILVFLLLVIIFWPVVQLYLF